VPVKSKRFHSAKEEDHMADQEKEKENSLAVATNHQLARLVDYAEGAVVSRTLVKNDAGNVTLFSFSAGQGLSEHTTPYDALVQVLEGEATLTIGGETLILGTGEIAIMPAAVPHAVTARVAFKMLLTMLKGQ
jgi:quercetin dioxygenase-like cupin family protein